MKKLYISTDTVKLIEKVCGKTAIPYKIENEDTIYEDTIVYFEVEKNFNLSRKRYISNADETIFISENGYYSQKVNTGKLFRILYKKEGKECEALVNRWKQHHIKNANVEIYKDIKHVYDKRHARSGSIADNCMENQGFKYEFLNENSDKVFVACIEDKYGSELKGRALIWNINGRYIMDRVYSDCQNTENILVKYAKEREMLIRTKGLSSFKGKNETSFYDFKDERYITKKMTVKLKIEGRKLYILPYMDTFCYGKISGDYLILKNYKEKDFFLLRSTKGIVINDKELVGEMCNDCNKVAYDYTITYHNKIVCDDCLYKYYLYLDEVNGFVHISEATICNSCFNSMMRSNAKHTTTGYVCNSCIDAYYVNKNGTYIHKKHIENA